MSRLDQFISYLNDQVQNHSIYVWGGQGETGKAITEAWIRKMENSATNASRAIAYWKKQVAAGYGDRLRAFDCSGLGVYWLCDLMHLWPYDVNADTIMDDMCAKISRSQLKRGDFVFRVNTSGRAYHIGYVVDDDLNVIEAKGRDDGVVKRSLTASGSSYWNRFGRPAVFRADILGGDAGLRKGDVGAAVEAMQKLLIAAGGSLPKYGADGDFGTETLTALKTFQASHALRVDGVYGSDTKSALEAAAASAGAPATDPAIDPAAMPTLLVGDTGEDVKTLQQLLIASGYDCGRCGVDGVFGTATYSAVCRYQKTVGLGGTGTVGPKTWAKLLEATA